ncbi:ATP-binding cassette domain-containing protein [Salininema proteolyticum]|uniref:ATP-binding cassette domain-containing protein n=1 Tax=Salininema proteolyticum TaxID=1607685 RepID=A0ABV8TWY7_9ACTN
MAIHFARYAIPFAITALLAAGAAAYVPYAITQLVDSLASDRAVQSAVILTGIAAGYTFLRWLATFQVRFLVYRIDITIQRVIFRRLAAAPSEWLTREGKSSQMYLSAIPAQISQLAFVVEFVTESILILVLTGVLTVMVGWIGPVVLAAVVAGSIGAKHLIDKATDADRDFLDSDHRRSALIDVLVSAWQAIDRGGLIRGLMAPMKETRSRQRRLLRRRALRSGEAQMAVGSLPYLVQTIAVALIIMVYSDISTGEVIAILVIVRMILFAVGENLISYEALRFGASISAQARRMFDETKGSSSKPPASGDPGSLTFSGPDGGVVEVPRGARVLIVGATPIHTQEAFSAVERATALGNWNVSRPGDHVTVSRSFPLWDGSIEENAAFWRDSGRVESAFGIVGLSEEVKRMREGADTVLSSTTSSLSDGQRVRLGIAQALLLEPDLLMLEDVFAPLDPERGERLAQNILTSRSFERTVVFTSTRSEYEPCATHRLEWDGANLKVEPMRSETPPEIGAVPQARQPEASDFRPPPTASYEKPAPPPRGSDFLASLRTLYSPWALILIVLTGALAVGMEYVISGLAEQADSWPWVLAMATVTLIGATAAWVNGFTVLSSPIDTVDRLHTRIVGRLAGGGLDQMHESLVGRFGRDFYSLETRVPTILSGTVLMILSLGVSATTVALTGWQTLPVLAVLAVIGWAFWRIARPALIDTMQLSANVRGPLLNFARTALSYGPVHTSRPLQKVVNDRFDDLASVRAVIVGRAGYIRLLTLFGVEMLGLGLFLTAVWAVALLPLQGAIPAGVVVYAAFVLAQSMRTLVDNLQMLDGTILQVSRVAGILGERRLPSRKSLASEADGYDRSVPAQTDSDGSSPVIELKRLVVDRPGVDLPSPVSFTLGKGEFVAVTGPSGCGKSLLLRTIALGRPPAEGTVRLWGRSGGQGRELMAGKGMFIDSEMSLLPVSVSDFFGHLSPGADSLLQRLSDAAGVPVDPASQIDQLSLAERQLVNLARCWWGRPELILADEATSALTAEGERAVLTVLREFSPDTAQVAVLHRAENLDMADSVSAMKVGDQMIGTV